jgi:hypothetical protein
MPLFDFVSNYFEITETTLTGIMKKDELMVLKE